MNKTYFKPQLKVVKLHGRKQLLTGSFKAKVTHSTTNLGDDDDFDYKGAGDFEAR